MRFNFSLKNKIVQIDQTNNLYNEASVPEIDMDRVKKITMHKIQQDKRKKLLLGSRYTKAACTIIAAVLITAGSVYAFSNEGFKNIITQLTGVQQTKVLMVGEAVSNRDYRLKVHEFVTDSYVGDVVVSIEALSDKSKETFENYRINLNNIGSGYGLRELEEYKEPYTKYYEISFGGATFKDAYNNGELQFSVEGMKKAVKVSLASTVQRIDMNISEADSNDYRFKFDKLHLSEIGLTLEGADTRNIKSEYWYNVELILADGSKELLRKKLNENENISKNLSDEIKLQDGSSNITSQKSKASSEKSTFDTFIDGKLIQGGSERLSGDEDDYVAITMNFSKNLPLDSIKQVIINDIAYDIKK